MCRLLIFTGSCTRCGEPHVWQDLSQQLSCLKAKNSGTFGECDAGVFAEHHDFDQECDRCADEDEGVGDVVDQDTAAMPSSKRAAEADETRGERKKQKT